MALNLPEGPPSMLEFTRLIAENNIRWGTVSVHPIKPSTQFLRHSFWGKWFLLALLIGVFAGAAAIVFQSLTHQIQELTLRDMEGIQVPDVTSSGQAGRPLTLNAWQIWMIIPIIGGGGLLSGLLVYWLAPAAEGSGIDGVIDAFHNQRGLISWRVPIVKLLASAVTLGTGGSAGREGPIALDLCTESGHSLVSDWGYPLAIDASCWRWVWEPASDPFSELR